MAKFEIQYKQLSENALLIEWPSRIDEGILRDILTLQKIILQELESKIEETQNTYNSLLILFDSSLVSFEQLLVLIKKFRSLNAVLPSPRIWELPVCYDLEFGIDLETISYSKKMSLDTIIKLHTKPLYTVYFLGFLPGFLYLGGLPEQLFIPRHATPRQKIKKGAVAIGGSQTGVYPQESPGGWNIIGNCPISLFDAKSIPPCNIIAGDKVKFVSVSKSEYDTLRTKIENEIIHLTPLDK